MLKIIFVCGARPNFMKIAPVYRALARAEGVSLTLVHTGQHYDERMSKLFFEELNIPQPDVNLGVGSGSHAFQTAEIMRRFEPVCVEQRPDWVVVVGNVMIDTLLASRCAAEASRVLSMLELVPKQYGVVTLHRPGNVDDPAVFSGILDALESIAVELPLIYPVHPRARHHLAASGLEERIKRVGNLRIMDPLGYLDFLKLMSDAAVVLTDSGGIQEETTILGVPCLTLRANTERPITIRLGTNRLTGTDYAAILSAYRDVRDHPPIQASMPELWDGRASERIAACLLKDS